MPKEFTMIKVGESLELFKTTGMEGKDGAVMESLEDGQFCISVFLTNMSEKEKKLLKDANITVKLFKDTDYFLLPLTGFSDKLNFSLIFDPFKYKDKKRKENLYKSNMVTVIGVESTTNIVQAIRYCNMPRKLFLAMIVAYDTAKEIKGFSKRYDRWVDDLYSRYTDDQLWQMATYIGRMGE